VIVRKDLEDYKEKKLQEIQELEAKRDQELAETMDHYDRKIDTVKGKIVAVDELIAEHADELPESPGELV
jgi:hypothetical protein